MKPRGRLGGRVRLLRWGAAGIVAMGLGACGLGPQAQLGDMGQRWYEGHAPLQARMIGHTQDLPANAAACVNCHGAGGDNGRFAAALNRGWLTRPQARRGGPPSVYDAQRFCRALREGVDPAWVVVNQAMPRYALTDLQCRALWTHLTRSGPTDAPR